MAEPEQLPVVLDIIGEATVWVQERGFNQWSLPPYDEDNPMYKVMKDSVDQKEVYLVVKDDLALATMTLQWEDEYFWGKRPDDAGYIHKLAIRSAYHGQKIGQYFMAWAENVIEEVGRPYARLDCMAENEGINRFYQSLGYKLIGVKEDFRWKANLYEKRVG